MTLYWPPSAWPDLVPGTETRVGDGDPDLWVLLPIGGGAGGPAVGQEHCVVSDPFSLDVDITTEEGWHGTGWLTQTYIRCAQTTMKLITGGKAVPARQSLFRINASARELLNKRAHPPYAVPAGGGELVSRIPAICFPITG